MNHRFPARTYHVYRKLLFRIYLLAIVAQWTPTIVPTELKEIRTSTPGATNVPPPSILMRQHQNGVDTHRTPFLLAFASCLHGDAHPRRRTLSASTCPAFRFGREGVEDETTGLSIRGSTPQMQGENISTEVVNRRSVTMQRAMQ